MMRRCPEPGVPLSPGDQVEVDRFAAFPRDSDPDPEETSMSLTPPEPRESDEPITDAWNVSNSANELGVDAFSANPDEGLAL